MSPRIYPYLSNENYHADPAISRSGIMKFKESPYKYWAAYINPDRPEKESTKAMDFGSAFHTLILEPELFLDSYIDEPEKVLLKDVGREQYDAYKKNCEILEISGKIILKREDCFVLVSMRDAVINNVEANNLITQGIYEQSYFWLDKESGLMCKARPDILHHDIIVDLKTCASASSKAYQHALVESGYHIQAAMIRDAVRAIEGRDIPNAINICVEKTYPYEIGIKVISEKALDAGEKEYKAKLKEMAVCFETNEWPSYEIESVDLPYWYLS